MCVVLRWIAVIRAWKRIIIFTCTHKLTTIKPKSCPNWAVMWKINLWPFICVDEKSNRNSCAFPKNDYKFKQCFVQQYKVLKLLNITTFTYSTAVQIVYAIHRQTEGISSMAKNGILCVSTSCTTSKNEGKEEKNGVQDDNINSVLSFYNVYLHTQKLNKNDILCACGRFFISCEYQFMV